MDDNQRGHYIWLDANVEEDEVPAWKSLDNVIRKWAVLSQHEDDLAKYTKIQEMYTLK